jgi:hypothetical protein
MVYLGYTTLAEQLSVDLGDIVIGLKNLYNRNIMMKKLIFNTAKEQFRKAFKKHKSQVTRAKREAKRGINVPVEPYGLKKLSIKNAIKRTKFMDKAAYKAAPKTKSLPKGGPRPSIVGKAYASDKAAKRTMMIPMMTKKQREANQESISQSVRKFLKERIGRKKKGGVIRAMKGRFI